MEFDLDIIRTIVQAASLVPVSIICILLFKKFHVSRNAEGKRDAVTFLVFFSTFWWAVGIFLSFLLTISGGRAGYTFDFNIISMSVVFTVLTLGSLIAYTYHKREYYFLGWYFYGALVLYYFLTGSQLAIAIQLGVITVVQTAVLIFLYANGIKLKDNKLLGLAIFLTFPMLSAVASNFYVYVIQTASIAVYGLFYAAGKVVVFKPRPLTRVTLPVAGQQR